MVSFVLKHTVLTGESHQECSSLNGELSPPKAPTSLLYIGLFIQRTHRHTEAWRPTCRRAGHSILTGSAPLWIIKDRGGPGTATHTDNFPRGAYAAAPNLNAGAKSEGSLSFAWWLCHAAQLCIAWLQRFQNSIIYLRSCCCCPHTLTQLTNAASSHKLTLTPPKTNL